MTELDKADTEETDRQTTERSRYRILFNIHTVCQFVNPTDIVVNTDERDERK